MSDIGVAEIPVDEDERPLPPPKPPAKNALLDGPILRTLLWLAWPNVVALSRRHLRRHRRDLLYRPARRRSRWPRWRWCFPA